MTAIQTHKGLSRGVALFAAIATVVALSGVAVLAGALQANAAGHAGIVDGDLIRVQGTNEVYIVKIQDNELYKRVILTPTVFESYGHLEWDNVQDVSQAVADEFEESNLVMEVYPDGTPVTGEVYMLAPDAINDTGTKHHLQMTPAAFEAEGYSWKQIYNINHTDFLVYNTGAPHTASTGDDDEEVGDTPGVEGDMTITRNPEPGHSEADFGDSNHAALGFKIEAEDSALSVQRVDVTFDNTGASSDDLWDMLDSVSLYVGGSLVATMAATEANFGGSGDDRVRFQGFTSNVPADGERDYEVRLSFTNDTDLEDTTLNVSLQEDAVRAVDGAGINVFAPANLLSRNVTLSEIGEDVPEVSTSRHDDSAEGVVLADEDNSVTVETLRVELEVEENSIEVDDLSVTVTLDRTDTDAENGAAHSLDDHLAWVRLSLDGTSIGNEGVSDATSTDNSLDQTLNFTDLGLELSPGTYELSVEVRVRAMGENSDYEGMTLKTDLEDVAYTWEDSEGDEQTTGSPADGRDGHELNVYTAVPVLTLSSASITRQTDNTDHADATLSYTVTAEGDDVYFTLAETGTNGAASGWEGGAASGTASWLADVSGADEVTGDVWLVEEGNTATITFTVVLESNDGGFYRVVADSFAWGLAEGDAAATTWTQTNADWVMEDLRTGAVHLTLD